VVVADGSGPLGSGPPGTVRPAAVTDAGAVGAVQARSWRQAYRELLPADTLGALSEQALSEQALADVWRSAIVAPPSARHRVLVACRDELVVGFAAVAPARDPDSLPTDGELVELAVDPAHQGQGHGSRLLAAATDVLLEGGCTTVRTWVPVADRPRQAFLASAGLHPDGARRTLAAADGTQAEQERLAASLDAGLS
jgi:GNAT superfamily N-acetyltransferase